MRTTLDLDDDLMNALLARHPDASKTRAVEDAIRDHLHRSAGRELLRMSGTVDIEDISAELRERDRRP